ncbi:phosphoketolase family protein [Hymenobacter negativus]|uniref:Phosphoketolase family protein n=1 Tax=Hymenobacter negativus TaxID=2795026 RepID=A0ABS0Q3K4_9BACT|nr:phosphoketolase family protein [Hymenobacter negativus]MBH8556953.1 phosphoketolase family protein [Hymenobacter negativus]
MTPELTATAVPQATRLARLHRYWLAANYLGAAQLYLRDNFLLERPLQAADIKPRLLGHWGTQPGLNLVYAHLNRLVQDTEASVLLVTGPGHGAPAILANLFLEGTLGEVDPQFSLSRTGLEQLIRQFSWPGGLPAHLGPGTPGQIQEGGELGHCLAHAYGAALDNPDLIVACVVGDGEAETGPLAAAWHSNRYLNPATSGAVLPILHVNGYKLSGPSIFGRMSDDELRHLFTGYGYQVRFVSGSEPHQVHAAMWQALDWAHTEIRRIQEHARLGLLDGVPAWPMLILQTPKGWTCPLAVDGQAVENTARAHQLPVADPAGRPIQLPILERWLRCYRPQDLCRPLTGALCEELLSGCPTGEHRLGRNPHANGGQLLVPLRLPNLCDYGAMVSAPGGATAAATHKLATFLRDVFRRNEDARNFRVVCPDETTASRLLPLFEATQRAWLGPLHETDEDLAPEGRVMEMLSEQTCQGWLEGYLLTGRHGVFCCCESFMPLVDSMLNHHAKWLETSKNLSWRQSVASFNYLLTSHVWRPDHHGHAHQVPSFLSAVAAKKSSVARVYLPPDANCLLAVMDSCLRSRDAINLVVTSQASQPQWLGIEAAREHCKRGISAWHWAGNESSSDSHPHPDLVLAGAGDVPTQEIIAAAALLRQHLPSLRLRVVNVMDLLALMAPDTNPPGLSEAAFLGLFSADAPVIFAFHGYPLLIHELLHHRPAPARFHVHGYLEESQATTPFDMLVLNNMSRYQLVMAALDRIEPQPNSPALAQFCQLKLTEHAAYIREHGIDMPEVRSE